MDKTRDYVNTHPWLKFDIDLRRLPAGVWIALGEAQSICHQIAGSPLKPSVADELHQIYLAKGVQATTAIEGNTLTAEEVKAQIAGKLQLPPTRAYLGQEIDNVVAAANEILAEAESKGPQPITVDRLRSWNTRILEGLTLDPSIRPGQTRTYSVGVAGYRGVPHQDCDFLLERLCDWLNSKVFMAEAELEVVFGLLKSIVAHLYFVWIHPFGDGNGRTARLMEVRLLLEAGVPSTAAHLLSNHYNLTKDEYYRQLDAASRSGGDLYPFIEYAVRGYVDHLGEHMAEIRALQWHTTWINYVHEVMGEPRSPAERRRLKLILALSYQTEPVPKHQARRLTPELAEDYAGKTNKTLTRDLNALRHKNLITMTQSGIVARREIVQAFLPRVRRDSS